MSDESEKAKREEREAILDNHVQQLGEHFDNVQIFVSTVADGGDFTVCVSRGAGNWHARVNQAREFVLCEEENIRENVKKWREENGE